MNALKFFGGIVLIALQSTAAPSNAAGLFDISDASMAIFVGNTATAISLLEPLAKNNEPTAQLLLGRLYLDARLPERNCRLGLEWLSRSAEGGNPEAAMELGDAYLDGDCVVPDEDTGIEWYTRAADRGYSEAPEVLGEFYFGRRKDAADYRLAEHWFLAGANLLNAGSCFHLGLIHAQGIGIPADRLEAYVWFDIAADLANSFSETMRSALRERDRIREELTPLQVQEARHRAATLLSLLNLRFRVINDALEALVRRCPAMSFKVGARLALYLVNVRDDVRDRFTDGFKRSTLIDRARLSVEERR